MVKALRSCLEAAKGKIKAGWNLRQASKLCNVPRKSCSLGSEVGFKALRAETRISTIPSSHATDRDPLRGRDPLRHLQYLDATNEWASVGCMLFGRRPACRVVSSSLPASENLHRSGLCRADHVQHDATERRTGEAARRPHGQ